MRTYFRILRYGKKFEHNVWLAIFFLILYNIAGVFSITLIIPFLDTLFNQAVIPEPDVVNWLKPDSIKAFLLNKLGAFLSALGNKKALLVVCMFLGSAIFSKNVFRYLAHWFMAPYEYGILNSFRRVLFQHLSRLGLNFFTKKKKGEIVNLLVSDVQIIQESVAGSLGNIFGDPITMVVFLFTMIILSWKLTLFSLVILPVTGFFINIISKSLRTRARIGQERLGKVITIMEEFISGIRVVKAFGTEEFERRRYDKENDDFMRDMNALKRKSNLASPMTEVLSIGVLIGIILFGGNMVLDGSTELTASHFLVFIALFAQFLAPIKSFSNAIARMQKGIASFHRVEEFQSIEESVKEATQPLPVSGLNSRIIFDQVSFSYDETEVLSGINLEINIGQTVALVGPSGGGKSTLADLLPRFYDPSKGKIELDGTDIRKYVVRDLRNLFSVVTQEGILFNDSLIMNIAYGDPNPDIEKVKAAAKAANADEFIAEMPEGYHSILGERGTKLSGGQRQRIAIARAIYKDAPILILDEATSALDSESERSVQEALEKLMEGRTAVVIAHRLSTIIGADRILVVDKGRISESGSHETLIAQNGLYRRLYDLQFNS